MSWFSKVEGWFKKFFSNTNWAHNASVGLALAGPPAILIVQETLSGSDATEAQNVLNEVQTDLGTVSMLLAQAQSAPTNATISSHITSILNVLKANLGTILADAHVKNAANVAKITELVNAFVSEIEAILSMIPAAAAPTPPPPAA